MSALFGYSIRQGTVDDARQLSALDRRSQPAPWTAEQFAEELRKPFAQILVITDDETDEQVVAFAVFWLNAGGSKDCEILNIAVDLRMRRLGLGMQLMEAIRRQAMQRQCARIVLNVRKSNAAAIALYQKARLAIRHTRKGFYSDGEDANEMEILLDDADAELKQ